MKKVLAGMLLALSSNVVLAEGLSDGTMEVSINAVRSEGFAPPIHLGGSTFFSAPIRVGYRLNDQFTLFGGFYVANKDAEGMDADNGANQSMVVTGGAIINLNSGLMLEGSWSRLSYTTEANGGDQDFKGNYFEGFAGRRFQAMNGLFVEPKAGVTFGTMERDDVDADSSRSDNLGTEYVITVGYAL